MKIYEVFLTDIWNNNYLLGFYKDLDDAIVDINKYIDNEDYHLKKGDLKEYPSTFDYCFDTNVYDIHYNNNPKGIEDEYCEDEDIQIRGFILDSERLLDTISELENKIKE